MTNGMAADFLGKADRNRDTYWNSDPDVDEDAAGPDSYAPIRPRCLR
jgi:hypothetical protein